MRAAIYAMPAFHDKDGRFSRQMFEGVLRNNGLTEQGVTRDPLKLPLGPYLNQLQAAAAQAVLVAVAEEQR